MEMFFPSLNVIQRKKKIVMFWDGNKSDVDIRPQVPSFLYFEVN